MSVVPFPRPASPQQADDSIDLQNARGRSQSFNWLAAVNPNSPISPKKTATPTPSPPTVTQTTPMRTANSAGSWCFSPEALTAMGSPIPIETDDAELPLAYEHAGADRVHRAGGAGSSPVPQLVAPQPFQSFRHGAVVPVGTSTATNHTPHHAVHASSASSPDGLPSPVTAVDATSPFAPSVHNSYSSAIMQALSLSEGAAIAEATLRAAPSYAASPTASGRPSDSLYRDGMRAKLAKQQWATVERARQELLEAAKVHRECSFTPTLSPYAAQVQRPAALRPENRAQAEVLRKKQWLAMKKQESIERELEECTFRPLTLRSVQLEPLALRSNPAVFDNLYEDAQDKQHFADEVRAQVVEEMETRVLYPHAAVPVLPQEKIAEVVDRLFSKGAIVATTNATAPTTNGSASHSYQPELAPRTRQIVEAQEEAGERNPDVVDRLYSAQRGPTAQERIEQQLEAQRERTLQLVRKQQIEEERQALAVEHDRALLSAKFRALSKRAASSRGQVFKPDRPQSVVALARASLDVLTSEESEELLYVLEKCTAELIAEGEFVERILRSVRAAPLGAQHALLRCPPPPTSLQEAVRRDQATAPPTSTALVTAPLPKVQRERADPEVLERAKARRERRMEAYREEKAQRAAADPFNEAAQLDENCTFQPAPRRLIPYECRPDVQIEVKPTRAFALRRARALGQPLPAAQQTDRDREAPALADRAPSASSSTQGTARLLTFTEGEEPPARASVASALSGRSTASVPSASTQRRASARARAAPRAHPTTYADIAQVREELSMSHNNTTGTAAAAPHAALMASAPRTTSERAQDREHHTDPVAAAAPRSQSSASGRTTSPHTNTAASIAELAVSGGEPALRQLGRELLLKQLRDFQNSRRQRAAY